MAMYVFSIGVIGVHAMAKELQIMPIFVPSKIVPWSQA
jgi:hypothetical protein